MTADILFDPLSAEFAQDPYRIYRQLRQRDQPYFYAAQNMWLLSRYDDISTIATSPACGPLTRWHPVSCRNCCLAEAGQLA